MEKRDIVSILWAFETSGIVPGKLAQYAKAGVIPGAYNDGGGWRGWKFNRQQFLDWLELRRTENSL